MCDNVERYARIDHRAAEHRTRPRPHHMRRSHMASKYSMNDRPSWPRRAIVTAGEHRVKPLPPRFDFFSKHESQY